MSLVTPAQTNLASNSRAQAAKTSYDHQKLPHTLEAAPLPLISRLFASHGLRSNSVRYWPKWLKLFFMSFAGMPFRFSERRSAERVRAIQSEMQPPVFLIGHWRSGTTYLHNLMTLDDQFGFMSMKHCIAADSFLTLPEWVCRIAEKMIPTHRPVDGVELGWNAPQEEEFAMERLTDLSYNHCYLFPDRAESIFRRSVLFEGGDSDRERWMESYDFLLKRLNYDQSGRALCLKNPPNTARLGHIHRQYPQAKFVFIVRHPEHVFRSTRKLWQTVTRMMGLTSCSKELLDENLLRFYELLMRKYLAERDAIPTENLVEIRYEDLDLDPVATIEGVYDHLNLSGFSQVENSIRNYLAQRPRFVKNHHSLSDSDRSLIQNRWGFAYDAWNYDGDLDPKIRAA